MSNRTAEQLDGILVRPLLPHADDRGVFTECFRQEWDLDVEPSRWELLQVAAGVPRPLVADVLIVLEGTVRLEAGGRSIAFGGDRPELVRTTTRRDGMRVQAVDDDALVLCGRS